MAKAPPPTLRELSPEEWEKTFAAALQEIVEQAPEALKNTTETLPSNALLCLLLRLRVREELAEAQGAKPREPTSLAEILALARQTPLGAGEVVDALVFINWIEESCFSPPPPEPKPRKPLWGFLEPMRAWAEFIIVFVLGGFSCLFLTIVIIYIAISFVFFVWEQTLFSLSMCWMIAVLCYSWKKSRPKTFYERALVSLSREKGVRVPRSITLASAFGKLAACCVALIAGLIGHLLTQSILFGVALGWTAGFGIKLCLFPRIAGYREWALKEIEANGGLWDSEE